MTGFPLWTRILILAAVLLLVASCAYYNTFYNAKSYYSQGVRLKEDKQVSQAKAKLDKAIEKSALVISRWPRSRWVDDATYLIGMSYYHMGQYGKAIRYFERLTLAFPNSPFVSDAELHRGLALLKDRELGVARVVLAEVAERWPRYRGTAAFHLAVADYERDDLSRAIDSLAAFVTRYPKSRHRIQAVRYLGDATFRLERWAEAQRWYSRLVDLARQPEERALARLKVAACRIGVGDCAAAVRDLREVTGRYAQLDDEAYLLLGRALYADSQVGEALGAWGRVRGSNDYGAEAFFRIGRHYEEGREFDQARAYYDTARMRRANSDYGVLAVARLSLLNAFAAGDSTERDADQAMFLLAEVHNLNLGEYDEAMRIYQAVHDSFPESDLAPKALFARAWLMKHRTGDTSGITPLLEQIIGEYPETDYADESRRWLGLPVPKRAPKQPKPDTTRAAVSLDTLSRQEVTSHPDSLPGLPFDEDERLRAELAGRTGEAEPFLDEPPAVEPEPMPDATTVLPGAPPGQTPEGPTVPLPVGSDTSGRGPDEYEEQPQTPASELEGVRFAADTWAIGPDEAGILGGHAELLLADPALKLTIVGHDDSLKTPEASDSLGLKRAEAVRDFLVKAGIEAQRIEARTEGSRQLLSTNPEEYWLDRRVEFILR